MLKRWIIALVKEFLAKKVKSGVTSLMTTLTNPYLNLLPRRLPWP